MVTHPKLYVPRAHKEDLTLISQSTKPMVLPYVTSTRDMKFEVSDGDYTSLS